MGAGGVLPPPATYWEKVFHLPKYYYHRILLFQIPSKKLNVTSYQITDQKNM